MPAGVSRRTFSKAALATTATALSAGRVVGANDRVRVGFIGVGNRGCQVTTFKVLILSSSFADFWAHSDRPCRVIS